MLSKFKRDNNKDLDTTSEITENPYRVRDFSQEVKLSRSPLVRWILVICGSIALGLGILGVFLPILPTTPFLLLAAACYAHSSTKFYNWLMNNRFVGPFIHRWRVHKSIPMQAKILAISMLAITVGSSIYFFIPIFWVKILVAGVGLTVSIYILSIKTG